MNRSAIVAWILSAIFVVAALAALVIHPVHWDRTFALTIVLAIVAGVVARRQQAGSVS